MPAQVSIKELNGASPGTPTTITTLKFCTIDSANPDPQYAIPIIAGETTYSFWKTIYLNADTSPNESISNVKLFCQSLNWTGMIVKVGTTTTYSRATGEVGYSGDISSVATNNITNYTQSNPLSINGSISNPNTGRITDYIVLQLSVNGDTATIPSSNGVIVFMYDER